MKETALKIINYKKRVLKVIKKNRISFFIGIFSVIIISAFMFKFILFLKKFQKKNDIKKTSIAEKGDITNTSATTQRKIEIYTIKEGDELWKIAQKKYGNPDLWTKLAEDNNLTDPNVIHAGNTLKIIR